MEEEKGKMEEEKGKMEEFVGETTETVTPSAVENGETAETPRENLEIVAVPYMNDGASTIQLFFGSMFRESDGGDALSAAERYFFSKFADDDEPKWDGVLVCLYDSEKGAAVRDERNAFVSARDFKTKWIWRRPGAADTVTFNVKCTMPSAWATHFQSMLRKMESCGHAGHSDRVAFNSDGAGTFRPTFKFSTDYGQVDGRAASVAEMDGCLLFSAT